MSDLGNLKTEVYFGAREATILSKRGSPRSEGHPSSRAGFSRPKAGKVGLSDLRGECLSAQDTSAEPKADLQLEIAHLLFIDVVGYSKLLVNEQIELIQELNQIVRSAECFRAAEKNGKLVRVPTGDGMVLLFFRSVNERLFREVRTAGKSRFRVNPCQLGVRQGCQETDH